MGPPDPPLHAQKGILPGNRRGRSAEREAGHSGRGHNLHGRYEPIRGVERFVAPGAPIADYAGVRVALLKIRSRPDSAT